MRCLTKRLPRHEHDISVDKTDAENGMNPFNENQILRMTYDASFNMFRKVVRVMRPFTKRKIDTVWRSSVQSSKHQLPCLVLYVSYVSYVSYAPIYFSFNKLLHALVLSLIEA